MRKACFFLFCFYSLICPAQKDTSFSVYLIGDAGENMFTGEALQLLKKQLGQDPYSAVVFLGDNVYPAGFSNTDPSAKLRIDAQLDILKNYEGQAYFIPGNHDWDAQKRKGLLKVKEQKMYVDEYVSKNTSVANRNEHVFFPADGLPGPATVLLNDNLRLIMLDTQWFLHFHKKNKIGSKKQTKELFYKRLDSLLSYSQQKGEKVLIAAHHPLYTNGSHARKLQPWRFLVNCTPFRIFGLCGIDRLFSQDIYQPGYRKMRKDMEKCLNNYTNVVYASGHEHNVQCFERNNNKFIVSGNGSKTSGLRKKKRFSSVFQDDSATGFVKLEYSSGNKVKTSIYRVGQEVKVVEDY